jgi:hypothetical protein
MLSRLRQGLTPIIGESVTIAFSFISDFLLGLPREFTWLTFFVGSMVTVAVTLLEMRLTDTASALSIEMGRKLEIYHLLERLDKNNALRSRASHIVNKCVVELQNLTKGILRLDCDEFYSYITAKMNGMTPGAKVFAIHIALEPSDMYIWDDIPGIANYYEANIAAKKRDVEITRVFVLKKDMVIQPETWQVLNHRIVNIMRQQHDDELTIRVAWDNELSATLLLEEFMIFSGKDGKEIQVNAPRPNDRYYNLVLLHDPSDIQSYETRYAELLSCSWDLKYFLKKVNGFHQDRMEAHDGFTNREVPI